MAYNALRRAIVAYMATDIDLHTNPDGRPHIGLLIRALAALGGPVGSTIAPAYVDPAIPVVSFIPATGTAIPPTGTAALAATGVVSSPTTTDALATPLQ